MAVRIWTAAQIQETARGLKEAGYDVVEGKDGDHDAYIATVGDDTVVLKARRGKGRAKYLVRYDERLFEGDAMRIVRIVGKRIRGKGWTVRGSIRTG